MTERRLRARPSQKASKISSNRRQSRLVEANSVRSVWRTCRMLVAIDRAERRQSVRDLGNADREGVVMQQPGKAGHLRFEQGRGAFRHEVEGSHSCLPKPVALVASALPRHRRSRLPEEIFAKGCFDTPRRPGRAAGASRDPIHLSASSCLVVKPMGPGSDGRGDIRVIDERIIQAHPLSCRRSCEPLENLQRDRLAVFPASSRGRAASGEWFRDYPGAP